MLSDEQLRNLPVVGSSACAAEIQRLKQSLAEAEADNASADAEAGALKGLIDSANAAADEALRQRDEAENKFLDQNHLLVAAEHERDLAQAKCGEMRPLLIKYSRERRFGPLLPGQPEAHWRHYWICRSCDSDLDKHGHEETCEVGRATSANPGQPLLDRLHATEERIRLLEKVKEAAEWFLDSQTQVVRRVLVEALDAVPNEPQKVVEPKA
jgi:hypothetical protein